MVQIFLVEMLSYIVRLESCSRVIHRAYDLAEPTEMVHNGFCYSQPHDLKLGTLCRAKTILTVHSVSPLSQFRCYFKSDKEMKHLAVPVCVHNVKHRTCVMRSIPQLKTTLAKRVEIPGKKLLKNVNSLFLLQLSAFAGLCPPVYVVHAPFSKERLTSSGQTVLCYTVKKEHFVFGSFFFVCFKHKNVRSKTCFEFLTEIPINSFSN